MLTLVSVKREKEYGWFLRAASIFGTNQGAAAGSKGPGWSEKAFG
jgi:hypothetical protein